MSRQLVLASGNPGKLREFRQLLAPLGYTVLAQSQLGVEECPEPHRTFVENALAKARHASRLTGLPALADDSGICVRALGGAPGVYSARYAGEPRSDQRNNEKLLQDIHTHADKHAHYVCVLVWLWHAATPQPIIAEGEWHGEITANAAGSNGFGYDPYFWLPDMGCTAAELSAEQKNAISHRGLAMQQLGLRLQQATLAA